MLYLVSTPIGNLKDITLRALEILKSADYILAEDTRVSQTLLAHFEIKNKLVSFHEHNEMERGNQVIEDLNNGLTIALISDAGTPLISDPGERLVKRCVDAGLEVSAAPGPCAAIAALTLSGLESAPFQFVGFLPRKSKEAIRELLHYPGVSIVYESPHRIHETLGTIAAEDPQRQVVVARELTKKFETVYRGTAAEVAKTLGEAPKGEIVLLIAKSTQVVETPDDAKLLEMLQALREKGYSLKEAAAAIADQFGLAKRDVYRLAVSSNNC